MRRTKLTVQAMLLFAVAGLVVCGIRTNSVQAHPEYGCASCHVPHSSYSDNSVPLWNPDHTTTTLTGKYDSPTMDAQTSAPDGASKLCLSCHDGSYDHVSADHTFGEGKGMGPLAQNHPISFVYDTALVSSDAISNGGVVGLVDPTTLAGDILDANEKMQCTSCHDIHATKVPDIEDDPKTERNEGVDQPNLRWEYNAHGYGSTTRFCRNCHIK